MEKRKLLMVVVAAVMVISMGGVTGYYWYMSVNYLKTDDACVDAAIFNISPKITAEITEMDIAEGDRVLRGAIIARQSDYTLSPGANLDLTIIKTPVSGTVIKKIGQPGEMGIPGQPVAMVADLDNLYVTANVEETDLYKIKPGQLADVALDAFPHVRFAGRVTSIGSATLSVFALLPSQNTGGNFTKVTQRVPVTISIKDCQGWRLMPGINAVVKIHLAG